ncbi:hypothetical protein Tco_0593194 [Tanacetum coccineum]
METKHKLDLDTNGTPVDATKYQTMIGSLKYLTSSIPNIVHATCLCAGFELTGFLDTDHVRCQDTFKSTSKGTQFLSEILNRRDLPRDTPIDRLEVLRILSHIVRRVKGSSGWGRLDQDADFSNEEGNPSLEKPDGCGNEIE